MAIYVVVLYLVYLTKTRLILLFLLVYPLLRVLMNYKKWFTIKRVFVIFLMTTLFIYFLYTRVTEWFPSLVTLRYENSQDSSFNLRFYLYSLIEDNFINGNWIERMLGKGNEFSRNFIRAKFDHDLMPHNDYIRILNDWGVVGFLLFIYFFYKIGTKNKNTLFVSLVFMLLFYSNMIFNLFMISILIIQYFNNGDSDEDQLKKT
ncbi:O-antigen ligase family protein [Aquimarina rubra]|uniref:O-antigen ligase family protein n=1 Tax=Aquimarina rubra TaxID=1920033 RepID=A0ABW5LIA2_9FLAO